MGLESAEFRMRLAEFYRRTLLEDVVPFWVTHGVDRVHGGITTCLDRDGSILDTDKGTWQQGRFAWLLGHLHAKVEPRSEWLEIAVATLDFVHRHAFDPQDGRAWFQTTREGRPLRKRRYAFSEAFISIACGEAYRATGDESYRELAIETARAFMRQMTDPVDPAPKFTDERPRCGIGAPMIALNVNQCLRDSIGGDEFDRGALAAVETIVRRHVHPELRVVLETTDPAGGLIDHTDERVLNPGHAIEAAWFVMEEGRVRGRQDWITTGCAMLDWMWERGWDPVHGGLFYFVDPDGRPVQEYWHDMKFWWPHAEAIIATLLAYELTGEPRFAHRHAQVHEWAFAHFPDPEFGEWYGYLHRDGSVSNRAKGNLWKGPFHLPRMLVTCGTILERMNDR